MGFGYHLWFLGFLFCFALITLPFFLWLKKKPGASFLEWMAKLCEHRGGLLLFIIPLAVVKILLASFLPFGTRLGGLHISDVLLRLGIHPVC